MTNDLGCFGIVVDANPDAIESYAKLGFFALETESGELGDRPHPLPMFLELGSFQKNRDREKARRSGLAFSFEWSGKRL